MIVGIISARDYTSSETAKWEAVGCTQLKMGLVWLVKCFVNLLGLKLDD